jgi:hypothetical protein
MWKRWINTNPYDEQGNLKPIWIKHIDHIRKTEMNYSIDSWEEWIDTTILTEGTTVETKPEVANDGDTVSLATKAKTEVILTKTELKDEVEVKVEPDIEELRQDLTALSRAFVETIVELKDEKTEGKPPTEYPVAVQGLSLHLDDPFAPAAVALATA